MKPTGQRVFRGIGASPGGAIGNAFLFVPQKVRISRRPIEPEQVEQETRNLRNALETVRDDIAQLSSKISTDENYRGIFEAYELVLDDPTLVKSAEDIIRQWKYPAAYAYSLALGQMQTVIENLPDELLRSRARDLQDIKKRVVEKLTGQQENPLTLIDHECIIVAHDLAPSDTVLLKREMVKGIITEVGSKTSHTAILAQALNIPAVVGTTNIMEFLREGDNVLIDGYDGAVILHPHQIALEAMERAWGRALAREQSQLESVNLPAVTLDGFHTEVTVNIEFTDEVEQMKKYGGEGVGLFRTEFLFMNQQILPTEEQQFQIYSDLAKETLPYAAIIRTVDLGGDKFASELDIPTEVNPFLGWRGIRLSLARQDMFRAQLRAILRASVHGKLRVMFPMISDVSEVITARAIMDEERQKLIADGIPSDPTLEVGVMIEVPSAALSVRLLAPHVDFFSIGTNDLIQYTLAVERGNERIAYLYEPFHPSVLRLLREVIETAHRNYLWVGLCGEMAGMPLAIPLLLGMGLDEFSVPPRSVPLVKFMVRSLNYADMRKLVAKVAQLATADEIRDAIRGQMQNSTLGSLI